MKNGFGYAKPFSSREIHLALKKVLNYAIVGDDHY